MEQSKHLPRPILKTHDARPRLVSIACSLGADGKQFCKPQYEVEAAPAVEPKEEN